MLTLPDGRRLAYNVYGPVEGHPVFYFHGAPSARIEAEFFHLHEYAAALGIRLIAPDRPGLGWSDYQPRRTIADWPVDVMHLSEHLGIGKFNILGYSGGGPYALACAQMIPERLGAVSVVSCTAPHDVPGLTGSINENSLQFMQMCVRRPRVARLMTRAMGFLARHFPWKMATQAISSLPEVDARVMSEPENGKGFARLVAEAARANGRGPQHDTALMVLPWPIDLSRIDYPIRIWHGELDRNAPIQMGRYLGSRLPQADPKFVSGEGHLSLMFRHGHQILSEMVARD
jgi:pimeloyl-ACP methyl ester carboxylesterase